MSAFIQSLNSGGTYLKHKTLGEEHTIKVERVTERQSTDFRTKEPLTFPSGDPIMEQHIIGQAWDDEAEDLVNAVLVVDKPNMRRAIGKALVEHGLSDLQAGGAITVKYTEDVPGKGAYPAKQFVATYKPAEPVGSPWGE